MNFNLNFNYTINELERLLFPELNADYNAGLISFLILVAGVSFICLVVFLSLNFYAWVRDSHCPIRWYCLVIASLVLICSAKCCCVLDRNGDAKLKAIKEECYAKNPEAKIIVDEHREYIKQLNAKIKMFNLSRQLYSSGFSDKKFMLEYDEETKTPTIKEIK